MNKAETYASRLAAGILRGLILCYRYSFAALFGGRCRFEPSCSAYALEAIERHGPARGAGLAVARLCRCHPFGKHGFDPVPPRVK